MNLTKEKQVMIKTSKSAGRILLRYYGNNEKVRQKPNKSLVSKADMEADKAIIRIIKNNFPNHSILSEETGFENNNSDYKWVIDPIDGTHNFLRKIPIVGISIALEYKNEVVIGVLEFPLLKLTAFAEKGKGAYLNGKKLKVSTNKSITHSFILYEFVSGTRHKTLRFLKNLSKETINIRNFGAAIYDLLLMASGQCDAFVIFTTNEWDIAAGMLLIQEAGGEVTDLRVNKCTPSNGSVLISNGKIHKILLGLIR